MAMVKYPLIILVLLGDNRSLCFFGATASVVALFLREYIGDDPTCSFFRRNELFLLAFSTEDENVRFVSVFGEDVCPRPHIPCKNGGYAVSGICGLPQTGGKELRTRQNEGKNLRK